MFCLFSSGELTSICSGELTLTKMLLFNTWCKLLSWKVVPGVKVFILGNFLPFDNDLFTPPIVNLYNLQFFFAKQVQVKEEAKLKGRVKGLC